MLEVISKVLETNFKVPKAISKLLKSISKVLKSIFKVLKVEVTKIPSVPFVSQVNGRAERNRQHFEVAKIFREIDPRRGGGWVLIVMRVILICDIDWDKSGLRNLKNQNLKFPSAGTTFPSVGATFQSARTKNAIPKRQLPQARYLLDCPFQKLGSRMDAPISTPGIDFNERFSTFKK